MRSYTPLYSSKWEKRWAEEDAEARSVYQDGVAAQAALESLERRFDALSALLSPQARETDGVKGLLQGAKDDIRRQKQSSASLMDRLPAQIRVPKAPALAQKVFWTPELAENIFNQTSVPDLLRLYRVNKTFKGTIEGSPTLQRRLGLEPHEDCHLDLPAEHLVYHEEGMDMNNVTYSGFRTLGDPEPEPNRMPIKISVCSYGLHTKHAAGIELRPLGDRTKNILITQPPIKEMGVYCHCCTRNYRPYRDTQTDPPLEVLKCETGITTGQVWEVVSRAQKEHRMCPNAEPLDHDSEGYVRLQMTLEGSLMLKDDDPMLVAKNKRVKESREEELEFQGCEQKFRPYVQAKRSARDNGEPIPTFAEWQARAAGS